MTTRRRRFTAEFKKKVALEALRGAETVQAIAARHEVEYGTDEKRLSTEANIYTAYARGLETYALCSA